MSSSHEGPALISVPLRPQSPCLPLRAVVRRERWGWEITGLELNVKYPLLLSHKYLEDGYWLDNSSE